MHRPPAIANSVLRRHSLSILIQYQALVCSICRHLVRPHSLNKHCKTRLHVDPLTNMTPEIPTPAERRDIEAFCDQYDVPMDSESAAIAPYCTILERPPDPDELLAPLPQLPVVEVHEGGAVCRLCWRAYPNVVKMARHMRDHGQIMSEDTFYRSPVQCAALASF